VRDDAVEIVVVGESSARGDPFNDPYHPGTWLSIGQIVTWQLERAIPSRRFHLEILAVGGSTLEQQHQRLAGLKRRPDLLIVYAGHNEFHSRFAWSRVVPPARPPTRLERLWDRLRRSSPLGLTIREAIARNGVRLVPPPRSYRQVVEWPVYSPEEYAELRADFERRLDAIVTYCEQVQALPVLVIPPGNDAGYEPNRSVVTRVLSHHETDVLAQEFLAARAAAREDPSQGIARFRSLLARQPQFAEAHYRLAQLLEHSGHFSSASEHFVRARDLDGFPQRCPTDFQNAYRAVAARHPGALLIDGPALFRALSPHGILDDNLFHDAMHPALVGHIALAQAVLNGLCERRAFGWPNGIAAPAIDPAECAEHFGLDQQRWFWVCYRSAQFYDWVAHARYDPTTRHAKMLRFLHAAHLVNQGRPPDQVGIPGLGVHPVPVPFAEPGPEG
jgi:hypothetical protein